MITRPFFVVENLNNNRPYSSMNMREPYMFNVYGCLKPSRNKFHSVLLLVSSNSHHVANNWLPTRGKGHIQVGTSSWDVERQWERYKTIDLIAEYNHFTWECNHMPTLSAILPSRGQSNCLRFKNKAFNFSYSHIFRQNKKWIWRSDQ